VLDAHPSHRIEIPDPARDIAAGRPDACTLCHVEADRAWAARERARLWPPRAGITPGAGGAAVAAVAGDGLEPLRALFAGDPVARALAADALGRAGATAGRMAALLEAMSGDRYPAVRRLAARALVGLLAAPHPEAAEAARSFDATAPRSERQRRIASIEALLPQLVRAAPAPTEIAALRARARLVDIDIGE
jgi:hypothetical protein